MISKPVIRETSLFVGRIKCHTCKKKIATEHLLYFNGRIYCPTCGDKVLARYNRDIKKADSPEWLKFQAACENALIDAYEAAEKTDDGGTCNRDCTFIEWPRVNQVALSIALERAGVHGSVQKWFGSTGVMVYTPPVGQGNKNADAAEAMTAVFKKFGYKAHTWCQMD